MFMDQNTQYCKDINFPKVDVQIQSSPNQNLNSDHQVSDDLDFLL